MADVPTEYFVSVAITLVALWRGGAWFAFQKAGEPGWCALIPFFYISTVYRVAQREFDWEWLRRHGNSRVYEDFAYQFGKSEYFGWGLAYLPFVFFPILGFGPAKHRSES